MEYGQGSTINNHPVVDSTMIQTIQADLSMLYERTRTQVVVVEAMNRNMANLEKYNELMLERINHLENQDKIKNDRIRKQNIKVEAMNRNLAKNNQLLMKRIKLLEEDKIKKIEKENELLQERVGFLEKESLLRSNKDERKRQKSWEREDDDGEREEKRRRHSPSPRDARPVVQPKKTVEVKTEEVGQQSGGWTLWTRTKTNVEVKRPEDGQKQRSDDGEDGKVGLKEPKKENDNVVTATKDEAPTEPKTTSTTAPKASSLDRNTFNRPKTSATVTKDPSTGMTNTAFIGPMPKCTTAAKTLYSTASKPLPIGAKTSAHAPKPRHTAPKATTVAAKGAKPTLAKNASTVYALPKAEKTTPAFTYGLDSAAQREADNMPLAFLGLLHGDAVDEDENAKKEWKALAEAVTGMEDETQKKVNEYTKTLFKVKCECEKCDSVLENGMSFLYHVVAKEHQCRITVRRSDINFWLTLILNLNENSTNKE